MYIKLMTIPGEEVPLWKELWIYFYETYFTDNNVYENLGLGTGTLLSPRIIIIGLFIGLVVAAFGALFNKRYLGNFVRRLLSEEALSPEKAKTLSELDYGNKKMIRAALRKNYAIRRVVRCVEEEEHKKAQEKLRAEFKEANKDNKRAKFKETEYKQDAERDRYYIPEELKYMADVKFDSKGTTLRGAIAFIVLAFVGMILLIIGLPYILKLIDDLIGSLKNL